MIRYSDWLRSGPPRGWSSGTKVFFSSSRLALTPEGKRQLPRPRYWWEDNIKMDLKREGIGWYGLNGYGS
jgi:hypothetical protein